MNFIYLVQQKLKLYTISKASSILILILYLLHVITAINNSTSLCTHIPLSLTSSETLYL